MPDRNAPSTVRNVSSDTRTAVLKALTVIRKKDGIMPSASARHSLDTPVPAGTVEKPQLTGPNVPQLVSDPVDWHGVPHATKPVIKATGSALLDRDFEEHSRYAHRVELAGYIATCAPLLEPDELAQLVKNCTTNHSVYAPIGTLVRSSNQLGRAPSTYDHRTRPMLLSSLWECAHDGRRWEHTVATAAPKRKRGKSTERSQHLALQQQAIADSDNIAPLDELCSGLATWDTTSGTILWNARIDNTTRRDIAAALETKAHDPDVAVFAARLRDLLLGERPENPTPHMRDVPIANGDSDEETIEELLDDNATSWADLYPETSRARYPYPTELVQAIHNTPLPGAAGDVMKLCRNANELRQNAAFIGNCTFGWNHRCINGNPAIGRVIQNGTTRNFEPALTNDQWQLGQINCRFDGLHGLHGFAVDPANVAAAARFVPTPPRKR